MSHYDRAVVDEADAIAQAVQAQFFAIKGEGAVTLSAIAGAGKSFFVTDTVQKSRQRKLRVAVAAPTNEQVFSLVRSIAQADPAQPVAYLPAKDVQVPEWVMLPNVQIVPTAHQASGSAIVVGTIDKLASARNPRNASTHALREFDALIIDESYQTNAAKYYAIAGIAPRHLCVGDSGQILPFTTVETGRQWRGLSEDPLQTAVGVLHANHPKTAQFRFPITRRLDSRGVMLAKHFYPPDHAFRAALLDGVRSMRLGKSNAVLTIDRDIDYGLDLAAKTGWAYLEQPAMQTLVADPDTANLITDLIGRLNYRGATLVCERYPHGTMLTQQRIAIAVSRNEQ
ncbi:hypothetical protein QFZ99_004752, partial [Paraburkholderia atlantica]|uniref:AAA family ATPase n=1 Tax=Paraburkholderia atlantica TaxID=2654982 RepID=UPI003D26351C